MVVAGVLIVGLALIVYARTSRPPADASAPQVYTGEAGDHWHAAYGFQLCRDLPDVQLAGDLEERDSNGNLVSQAMQTTGVHSHNDGVIHWHAWSVRASGRRAQLGIFFDNYNVELSDDKLVLPDGTDDDPFAALNFPNGAPSDLDEFPLEYETGETQCGGEDAELKVVVWTDYLDSSSDSTYTSNFDEIPFDDNGLVIVVAFVPPEVDVVMPAWAADLPRLGAIDSASGVVPAGESTVPSSDVTGTSEAVAERTEPAAETTDDASGSSTTDG